jgi:hypothetical protein
VSALNVSFVKVTEDDALFSKKCKLFYKKEGNYVEKGVGMLYLKAADNGKTQVLTCTYVLTAVFRIRYPVLFYPPDPGSGMEQWSGPDPG